MQRLTWILAGISLLPASPVRAGLYNLSEPVTGPAASGKSVEVMPFPEFRNRLVEFIQIGNAQVDTVSRKHYLERRDELERKHRRGTLSPLEAVDLSAYLIRLKEYDAAVELLNPLARERGRDNYFVIANLITAHFLNGQLPLASAYLFQVDKSRPPAQGTINSVQADWFARVEPYFWKLLRLRRSEGRSPPSAGQKPGHTLDDLFGVRFVGESGQYEPGKLAAAEQAKLPKDALAIVQQLVLWLPDDTRLYWLLGELLNAQGDVADANVVLDECRYNRRFDAEELQQHHRLIKEALASATPAAPEVPLLPSEPPSNWFAGKTNLLIGGAVVGLVVVLLGYLQVRELRRRGLKSR